MRLAILATAILAATASTPSRAADLTIAVTGVASAQGQIMVALYNSADTFQIKPYRAVVAPAAAGTVQIAVKDLPAGDYAFALYHDANGNGKLDRNLIGMPTEDYAFSNNAMGKQRPPAYEAARFQVPAAGAVASVSLR
jgi:uncharacterized protein (DUF2141 family)